MIQTATYLISLVAQYCPSVTKIRKDVFEWPCSNANLSHSEGARRTRTKTGFGAKIRCYQVRSTAHAQIAPVFGAKTGLCSAAPRSYADFQGFIPKCGNFTPKSPLSSECKQTQKCKQTPTRRIFQHRGRISNFRLSFERAELHET